MTLPSCIASRADVDYELDLQLREAYRGDPQRQAEARERHYPLSLAGAVRELRGRGLDVSEDTFGFFCDVSKLRVIGRNYVLYPSDIDAIAERLAAEDRLSGLARRRQEFGVSYREELDAYREMTRRKFARAAEEVGVSEAEMWAGVRTGMLCPPDDPRWNPAKAKAWFAANRQNPEFLRDLHAQEVAQ